MRLQKYLADAGIASRRKCEELIADGHVSVNGTIVGVGFSVADGDAVRVDGKLVEQVTSRVVYAFYKPKNVICSNAENEDRIKVTDYFKDVPLRLYTVGRLDYDSEGLIFVTNDGTFADKLTHPRYVKDKSYRVLCEGEITNEERQALQNGVALDDGVTAPARCKILRTANGRSDLILTIHEGRNRQVRRMLAAIGHNTLKLCRVSIGTVSLGTLKAGERRELTADEIESMLQ